LDLLNIRNVLVIPHVKAAFRQVPKLSKLGDKLVRGDGAIRNLVGGIGGTILRWDDLLNSTALDALDHGRLFVKVDGHFDFKAFRSRVRKDAETVAVRLQSGANEVNAARELADRLDRVQVCELLILELTVPKFEFRRFQRSL
jgi:hypothetical protein